MFIESFWLRVGLLFVIFLCIASVDFYLKRGSSKKWMEYLFVLLMGALFSLFGILHDQITVTVSPEYYALGKELGFEDLRFKAGMLGAQAGMYAGIMFACVFLFVNAQWDQKRLLRWLKYVAASAFIGVIVGSILGYGISFIRQVKMLFPEADTLFLLVWAWHLGLYLGAITGLIVITVKTRNELKGV